MSRLRLMILMVAAGALLTTGCLSKPYPNKNYFSLSAELPNTTTVQKAKRYTLMVGTVNAASGFEDRLLVYRIGPNQYETDFYNEFVAAPARLLADLAAQHLDNINSKVRVVKNPGMRMADFGLETYLEGIFGDFTVTPPAATVNIRFTLNDLRGSQAKVIMDKTYRCTRSIQEKKPTALVAGMNVCVNEILNELNQDFEKMAR
ncbi:hypothetical protein C4J81_02485 [Deltaproteobacteria bacterium Smac51]|nr:hypothetical protein C4J81_02485 [Deltaproteobacteria bacterium Smac51]